MSKLGQNKVGEQPDPSWFSISKMQQEMQKLTWKHSLLLLIPAFIIYPRPFLYLLNPVIRRIRKSYRSKVPRLEKLIFTTNRHMTGGKVMKQKLYGGGVHNIYIINLFEAYPQSEDSQSLQKSVIWNQALNKEPNLFLQAQNAVLRIKMLSLEISTRKQDNDNFAILIKGKPELLRVVEAKVYGMDSLEYYKIPMFSSHQDVHILESTQMYNSYEQKIVKMKQ